jgi:hypothetical protein
VCDKVEGSRLIDTESSKRSVQYHNYDLYMHNDCFTTGHTQWFYFSVKNITVGQAVTINIRNFAKVDSLFNEGMRPLTLSCRSKRGWVRTGTNIEYYYSPSSNNPNVAVNASVAAAVGSGQQQNQSKEGYFADQPPPKSSKQSQKQSKPGSYVLTFDHTFEHSEDLVYFAYCLPYTYTDLQRYLSKMEDNPKSSSVVRRTELCRTLAGNVCDLLTITAPSKSPQELNSRIGVVFTARVHPGESNASFIMQGILDFLAGDSVAAAALRKQYVFKIVPMLNPDGVINGNYRCSLAGVDLNRRWSNPDPLQHPTVYHTKQLLKRIKKMRPIGLIMDIHGHSLKQGAFFYGCSPEKRLLRPRCASPALVPPSYSSGSRGSIPPVTDFSDYYSDISPAEHELDFQRDMRNSISTHSDSSNDINDRNNNSDNDKNDKDTDGVEESDLKGSKIEKNSSIIYDHDTKGTCKHDSTFNHCESGVSQMSIDGIPLRGERGFIIANLNPNPNPDPNPTK